MADRRALLLRAVLADPDQVAPRQVFADELTSHNDPRGEFILLEIALEGGLAIRKRDQLKRRRDELAAAHAAAWWPYRVKYRTRSGFIEFISGNYQQLVSLAPALFAAEPIVEVQINDVDAEDNAEEITKLDWLARLHALVLRGTIGDEAFAKLCANQATSQLTSLNVTANELSAEAFADLGDNLPACRSLVLTANALGDEGISALRAWRHLDKIERLFLSKCDLTGGGLGQLVSQPLPALKKLCIAGNELGGSMATFAKHAANLPRLRHLELVGCGLGNADVEALGKAALADIYRIDVRRNNNIDRRAAAREFGDRFRL